MTYPRAQLTEPKRRTRGDSRERQDAYFQRPDTLWEILAGTTLDDVLGLVSLVFLLGALATLPILFAVDLNDPEQRHFRPQASCWETGC